jgi:hypothetical protein
MTHLSLVMVKTQKSPRLPFLQPLQANHSSPLQPLQHLPRSATAHQQRRCRLRL